MAHQMMPKPWKRVIRESIAAKQTDSTDMHRELYPDLRHVWDELDDLREEDRRVGAILDERDEAVEDKKEIIGKLTEILDENEKGETFASEVVQKLKELINDYD